ncbi:MAG: MipA/OmpV family protein [Gammaproteobacteria bacterium]|nr:MipA/OmpV family protein [Gammaproteobacteria bacterium]
MFNNSCGTGDFSGNRQTLPERRKFACQRRGGAFILTLWPLLAFAQGHLGLETTEPLEDAPARAAEAPARNWDLRAGALAAAGPDYEGAERYSVTGVPYVRMAWKDRIVFRGRSLEANLIHTEQLRLGPILRTRAGRDEDDDSALLGLGDVDRSWEIGGFLRYGAGPVRLRLTALQDVSGVHDGLTVDFGAGLRIPFDRPWFVVEMESTWASNGYMASYYGIDARQSARAGLQSFEAGSGFKDIGVNLASRIPVTDHWTALLSIGYKRLIGDAADSPIVDDVGNADQFFAAAGLMYYF